MPNNELAEKELEKRDKITQLVHFIDSNADGFVSNEELQSKMFMLDVDGKI